jgi:hypothetical protein
LVNKAGVIQRFPYARFERLWKGDPSERLPDYAGTFLRVAIAYVETVNREPLCIRHVDYLRIRLDKTGRFDKAWAQSGLRLAAESVEMPWLDTQAVNRKNLVRAEHLFSRRRYKHEFSWTPSKTQQADILKLALK